MNPASLPRFLVYATATVWLVSGLLAKVLGLVPRHQEIVARILGPDHAGVLTRLIGLGEIGVAAWILSRLAPRWCAAVQIGLVLVMNALEAVLAPDLLLWGRWNAGFAVLFAGLVYYSEFVLRPRLAHA